LSFITGVTNSWRHFRQASQLIHPMDIVQFVRRLGLKSRTLSERPRQAPHLIATRLGAARGWEAARQVQ
jgi:hypothetical protein